MDGVSGGSGCSMGRGAGGPGLWRPACMVLRLNQGPVSSGGVLSYLSWQSAVRPCCFSCKK